MINLTQRSVSLPRSRPGVELEPMLNNGHRRWLPLSIVALNSRKAISQATKIISEKKGALISKFLRSLPYSVIDVEPEHFSRIDKLSLSKLVREKRIERLNQFGGIQELVSQLNTDAGRGIESSAEAISLRRQTFGSNIIQTPSPRVLRIVLESFKDPILVLLFVSASLSLAFGIKQEGNGGVADGLSIYVSICLVVAAISFSNIWPTKQLHALSKSNKHTTTVVLRDGIEQHILAKDVVVGDVVCLRIGDQVPADGLYIDGNSFQANESLLTQEANLVEITLVHNPFLLAGSKATHGDARMLVTAVGMDTEWGEIVSSTCPCEDKTPLQVKLHKLIMLQPRASFVSA